MKPYFTRYYQYNIRKVLEVMDSFDELRICMSDRDIEALEACATFDESLAEFAGIEIYPTAAGTIVKCWLTRFVFGLVALKRRRHG